jgi:hypothetical protein
VIVASASYKKNPKRFVLGEGPDVSPASFFFDWLLRLEGNSPLRDCFHRFSDPGTNTALSASSPSTAERFLKQIPARRGIGIVI